MTEAVRTQAIVHSASRRWLHWTIAVVVAGALATGTATMIEFVRADAGRLWTLFSWHKSLGVMTLVLTAARAVLWILDPPRRIARHSALIAGVAGIVQTFAILLCLALPLFGLATDAFVASGAPILGIDGHNWKPAPDPVLSASLGTIHGTLALVLAIALSLHIAGALKHHFIDRDPTLEAMLGATRTEILPDRPAPLWLASFALIAITIAYPLYVMAPANQVESAAGQGNWQLVRSESRIGVNAKASGFDIAAEFTAFDAEIDFSPQDPGAASVELTIGTASFVSGYDVVDTEVASAEWLDSAVRPEAVWRAQGAYALSDGRYKMQGELLLKERAVPVDVEFSFAEVDGRADVEGVATFDRLAAGLGTLDDDASSEIRISFQFIVSKKEER